MAEEAKKPERKSRREVMYDSADSKKRRAESEGRKKETERGGIDRKMEGSADKGGESRMRERAEMARRHENEHRDRHDRMRTSIREMNKRHDEELSEASDHKSMMEAHRRHETERHHMNRGHEEEHHVMSRRQEHERQAMHQRHEQQMAAQTEAEPGNGAAPEAVPASAAA